MIGSFQFPDIGPEILSFEIGSFAFALRWYAMAYIVGILIGWRIALMVVRRPRLWSGGTSPMTTEQVDALVTWVILGIILGGRLGFVLFYQPGHYLRNPLDILKIWEGGMSFHGGMLGVAAALLLYCRAHGVAIIGVADIAALATPPGLFLGRVANFINNELWGRPTGLPWGVVFPGPDAQDCPGVLGPCARHPSQLYEAGLEGLLLGTILISLALGAGWLKSPGRITGAFVAGYGIMRLIVEFFRQADAQFITPDNPLGNAVRFGDAGLTMGQLLSLPMILLGVALILLVRRPK